MHHTYGMDIRSWLNNAAVQLEAAGISSARLDAEVLLAYTLKKPRSWLIAHQMDALDEKITSQVNSYLERRKKREPIAYITGSKEFYGREFAVTPDVLIPRPESETIVDLVKDLIQKVYPSQSLRLLDVGTGTGCLGISCKLGCPQLYVTVSDISLAALQIARKNAYRLQAKPIRYVQSDLLEHWLHHKSPKPFDIVIANLPYVDQNWQRSPETDYEPTLALFSDNGGLELIKKCIRQAAKITSVEGFLLLEADPCQHAEIISYAAQHGFTAHNKIDYCVALRRV